MNRVVKGGVCISTLAVLLQGRVEIMGKVVTRKESRSAVIQQNSFSANGRIKTPQLTNSALPLRRNWSDLNANFGYVSIDHLIPYSIVVR